MLVSNSNNSSSGPPYMTISIHVKVTVDPSNVKPFIAAFNRAKAVSIALPECLSSELYVNPNVPGQFKYVEDWHATLEWIMDVS
jgi:quinol monooxygenase YgiN